MSSRKHAPSARNEAAPVSRRVGSVLRSPGRALDQAARAFFEPGLAQHFGRRRFEAADNYFAAEDEAESAARAVMRWTPNDLGRRYDFSRVRVHADSESAESVRSLHASAYTVGNHIVLDPTRYSSRGLLAHELTHVLQQGASRRVALQRESSESNISAPKLPRKDYVFIMGQDPPGGKNPYYSAATRFYRAHEPGAVMVTDLRNLTDVLSYIGSNVTAPIGNLIIVSHANEDGTVSFGLNAEDKDKSLTVPELRAALHPTDGSVSKLPSVAKQIDTQTRVHLKGCDLGRTQGIVELFDEAFGGAGVVNAPTHEQDYGYDPTLAAAEEKRVREAKLAEYTATLQPIPEQPGAVDPKLQGAERKAAVQERNAALAARKEAIKQRNALIKLAMPAIEVEAKQAGEVAGTYESFGGPMFQRPGTKLFAADELKPQVASAYGHLDAKQQTTLVKQLVTLEKVITVRPATQPYTDPHTLNEANIALADNFRAQSFRAKKLLPPLIEDLDLTIMVEGRFSPPGEKPRDDIGAFATAIPDEKAVLSTARAASPNPERYAWRIERTHKFTGITNVTAVGERVMAYVHHGSLDPSAHEHFLKPESDLQFYATSTFAPPPPKPPQSPAGTPP
jgi:hypothetical protein